MEGGMHRLNFSSAFDRSWGFEFLNQVFGFTWSGYPTLLNYLFWAFFGAFSFKSLIVVSIMFLPILWLIILTCKREQGNGNAEVKIVTPVLFVLLFALMVPWGISRPDELTFFNFRFVTFAAVLLYFTVDTSLLMKSKLKKFVVFSVSFYLFVFLGSHFRFHSKAKDFLVLLEKVDAKKVMHSLVWNTDTEPYAKMFRVYHFLPMYYTIRKNGVNTQFWAMYTKHLPIDYKKKKGFKTTPDWNPEKFKESDLKRMDYLAVLRPVKRNAQYSKAKKKFKNLVEVIECKGSWCLYQPKNTTLRQLRFGSKNNDDEFVALGLIHPNEDLIVQTGGAPFNQYEKVDFLWISPSKKSRQFEFKYNSDWEVAWIHQGNSNPLEEGMWTLKILREGKILSEAKFEVSKKAKLLKKNPKI